MYRGDKRYPRQDRMQYRWEFDQVKNQGSPFAGKYIVLAVLAHGVKHRRRIGYIITKRIGSAVMRNRIRRILREIYRSNRNLLRCNIAMVIVARPSAAKASYLEFNNEFLNLYHSAQESLWDSTI